MHVAEGTLAFRGTGKGRHKKGMTSKAGSPSQHNTSIADSLVTERGRETNAHVWHIQDRAVPPASWEGGRLKMPAKSSRSAFERHLRTRNPGVWRDAFPRQLKSVTPRCEFEYL